MSPMNTHYGLVDDWLGKLATEKCEAFQYMGRDDDGNRIKTLRAGYGFKPDNELVRILCLPRLVKYPLTNSRMYST